MLFALFVVTSIFGQNGATKRVAILEVIDKDGQVSYGVKLMIRSNLAEAITATSGYEGYDRVDLSSIMNEHEFQRTGMVSDADIKRLGEMSGAQYILVSEVVKLDEQNLHIAAKILNVESARIDRIMNVQSAMTATDIQKKSKIMAEELLNISSRVQYSGVYKKVAILEIVDRADEMSYSVKYMIRSNLSQAITATPGYEAYDRVDISSIMSEHEFQRTGMVSDADIKRLGEMTGAQYVLIAEVARITSELLFLTTKILDVETGKIEKTANIQSGISSVELQEASVSLAKDLLGWKGTSGDSDFVVTDEMTFTDIAILAMGFYDEGRYTEAAELYELEGQKGCPEGYFRLAKMYEDGLTGTGLGMIDRYLKAIEYYDKGLNLPGGRRSAVIALRCVCDTKLFLMYNELYLLNESLILDRIKSLKVYLDDSSAIQTIGDYYEFYFRGYSSELRDGSVVPDVLYEEIFEYYEATASQGDATAQYYLAHFYKFGYGADKDENKYRYWLQKAADQGYSRAVEELKGIENNNKKTIRSFLKR